MLGRMEEFRARFERAGVAVATPKVVQVLSATELRALLPGCDGWIIGDDPAGRDVLAAGRAGRLRAAVKWGVGVDNVDFVAAEELGIRTAHTPRMFGGEVADLAVCYLTMLARHVGEVDRGVRSGQWLKPPGISLSNKTVALIGFGDIGRNIARRLLAADMRVIAYDPGLKGVAAFQGVELAIWPGRLEEADFVVLACALTNDNRRLLGAEALKLVKPGVSIVNVSRGGLIDETALIAALDTGRVASAALDVYEAEPLPPDAPLRRFEQCVFGTHNASNTIEAVRRTSERAIDLLFDLLHLPVAHG
jgi:D-3-phosphoglycerate dehydrogenase